MAAPDFVSPNFYAETIVSPRDVQKAVSRSLFRSTIALVERSADFVTCAIGIFAANFIYSSLPFVTRHEQSLRQVASLAIVFALLASFLQHRDGAYGRDGGLLQIRETERAIRIPTQALALLLIIFRLLGLNFPWLMFLVSLLVIPALVILQKQLFFKLVRELQQREGCVDRVVVFGAGDTGRSVVSTLLHSPRLGFLPIALVDDRPAHGIDCILVMGYRNRRSLPVLTGPLTPALLKSLRADLLLLATPNLTPEQIASATYAASQAGSEIALLSGPAVQETQCAESMEIDGLRFAMLHDRPWPLVYSIVKRIADLVLSTTLMMLLAPFLFLIAILIRLDSPGPALFVQKRVGKNGELFQMYKFRSMYTSAPKYEHSPTTSKDRRITGFGRILRRTSLDELPQLINVFLGDMSLVGPRPEMPFIVEQYDDRQRQRLQVTPGITGLWQLSADRSFPIQQNIQYDLYYIRNRSFPMDIAILIHTLFLALHGGI